MGERRRLLEAERDALRTELVKAIHELNETQQALAAPEARARYLADELEASRGRSLPREP